MTRRLPILISCALTACTAEDNDGNLDSSPVGSASDTGTTGDDDDDAADDLDGVRLDVGVTSVTTADEGGSGGQSGGVGEGTDDDGGAESDGGSDESGAEVDMTACLPTVVFAALDDHMHELARTAELMTYQPSANQPMGFLLAPAMPAPPSTSIRYANVPGLPCSTDELYDPVCDGAHCYQVECTGDGTAWMTLMWNQASVFLGSFEFQHVYVLTSWNDVEPGLEFAIATTALAPEGIDASMLAKGRLIDHGFYVVEQFANLHEHGEVQIAYVWENDVFGGSMKIGAFTVAEVDAEGHLAPTGVCPEPET